MRQTCQLMVYCDPDFPAKAEFRRSVPSFIVVGRYEDINVCHRCLAEVRSIWNEFRGKSNNAWEAKDRKYRWI